MGNARWDDGRYATYTSSIQDSTRDQIFAQRKIHPDLDPLNIKVREAFDSDANPEATPLMLFCDVTGSMGRNAEIIVRTGLGKIMRQVYDHKPITDPQILCGATGDAFVDSAPLQATQFEAGVDPMTKQLEQIFLEGGGGGNAGESYMLAWWFAVNKTECHAITKRKRKGYLFTIGDEACLAEISKGQQKRFLGVGAQVPVLATEVLKQAQEFWNVFHLIVNPVAYQPVVASWSALLGERAVMVPDQDKLPETIVAIIRLCEGQTNVTADYDRDTAQVVGAATAKLLTAGA